MNPRIVSRILGLLLLFEACAMLACGLFARFDIVDGDLPAARALFLSSGITGGFGLLAVLFAGVGWKVDHIPRREAVLVVGLGWVISSIFGGVPYLLCQPYMNYAEAIFESASGFTTTGSSVMTNIEAWPRGLLLWRATTQLLGGIGILVLFVAVLAFVGVGSKNLFHNESSFRSGDCGMARIQDSALGLLKIYLGLFAACALGLRFMGLSWFNAICHAMATVSTGGFSPHNLSLGYYSGWGNGWLIELWVTLFMLMCSMNFLIYVVIMRKNWRRLKQEDDAKWLLGIAGFFMLIIAAGRAWHGDDAPLMALRSAMFTVATIVSTTGFGTVDYEVWPSWCKVLLAFLMLMGGCSGSTSGGFKVGRLLVFLKSAKAEIQKTFRPNLVERLEVNGNRIDEADRARTMFFLTMYFMIVVFATVVVGFLEAGTGIDLESCAGSILATISSIGPGFGSVGPTENFAHFREPTQLFLAWIMILGRLELFALLVLFFPTVWKKF
jgi:trk system potassium uptake protein TrkH